MNPSKLRLLLPAALLSASLPLFAQSRPVANRVIAPIDEANRVTLQGNVHPMAQARFDRGPAQSSNPSGRVALLLQRSAAQQQALTQYLADVQNPASPNYHRWLTPAQYGAQFGISDSDLAAVESWLQAQGLSIDKVPAARNVILFSGTLNQIQAAFHTGIHTFQVNGQTHLANVSNPQIPAALAPVVAGVGPLNDFRPKPNIVRGPHAHWDSSTRTFQPDLTVKDSSGNFLFIAGPSDAAIIYDSPNKTLNPTYSGTNYDGTGINLGLVGVSSLTTADVSNYRMAFLGETSTTVKKPTIVVDGNDPGLVAGGSADEALLDNEIAGGLAPQANIYFYTAADTDLTSGLVDATLRAIDDNIVSILSMSFGACELDLGASGNQLVNEMAQQAAAQGISFVVSAGDNGSAGCDDFNTEQTATRGLAASGFASTPYNIAVGGTDFDVLAAQMSTYVNIASNGTAPYWATAKGYIPESVWNDSTSTNGSYTANLAAKDSRGNTNIVAGSGGVSSCASQGNTGACLGGYAKPAFQTSLTPADNVRDLPDVSLFAADGAHGAYWALCSDSTTDGATGSPYTECKDGDLTTSGIGGAGGTSAAAPAFAGMLALIAQSQGGARLGQANYVLYQIAKSHASAFHDIAAANNSVPCATGSPNCGTNGFLKGYDAVTGYDTATGLGSVDLSAVISAWSSVSLAATSTTLKINGSSAAYSGVHGQSLTFNVGVNPTSATGNVAIVDTANMSAGGTLNNGQLSIPLSGGTGTATYNGLPGGTYTVTARYGGDTSNASSTSSPAIPVTISPEVSTTTLTVNAYDGQTGSPKSLSSATSNDFILLDAQVLGAAEGNNTQGIATGTVTFSNGSTQLGTATLDSGNNLASWPPLSSKFQSLNPGSYSVTASYSGDPSYNASTSNTISFTVAAPATGLALSNSGSITVARGATTGNTAKITIQPSGGFTGSVNLTCAVSTSITSPSSLPTCAVTTPVTITGTTAATATLTVNTTAASAALTRPLEQFLLGGGATLAMLLFFGIPARRRAWRTLLSIVAVLFIGGAVGCGGGGGSGSGTKTGGTTPGAYTVTVTGTDAATGKITGTTAVSVTVN